MADRSTLSVFNSCTVTHEMLQCKFYVTQEEIYDVRKVQENGKAR